MLENGMAYWQHIIFEITWKTHRDGLLLLVHETTEKDLMLSMLILNAHWLQKMNQVLFTLKCNKIHHVIYIFKISQIKQNFKNNKNTIKNFKKILIKFYWKKKRMIFYIKKIKILKIDKIIITLIYNCKNFKESNR